MARWAGAAEARRLPAAYQVDYWPMERLPLLEDGPLYKFSSWPNTAVPRVAAGVYSIWRGQDYVYVGMAGRGQTTDSLRVRSAAERGTTGLFSRLNSHASGRRSGDQFCVYVCDRFVLRCLSTEEIILIGNGALSLDSFIRTFIREHLAYRFIVTESGQEAATIERAARQSLPHSGPPLLNPIRTSA